MGTTEYKLLRTSTACTALSSKGDGRGEKRLGVCVGDSENYSLWIKVVKCPNGKWRACKTCGSLNPDDSPPLDDSITEPRLPVSAPADFRQSIRSQSTVLLIISLVYQPKEFMPQPLVLGAATNLRTTTSQKVQDSLLATMDFSIKKRFWVANAAVQFEGLSPIG
ncbi:hypothetical protein PoMZ_11542 [Pyricularia oryzae]|uniref:Uncharacterized protein n=1 Tax=Pyricularia oryzae TaxID=318829 RepID=A0A4P7NKS8_PYROR|nr:hypothetical protein PoMZ_11542 [Pyricularia oryzae]